MRLIALPGYADTPRYWSHLFGGLGTVENVEWPGIWGTYISANPLEQIIEKVLPRAPGSVLVAHSTGCRLALHIATQAPVAGVALLAPALGPLSILEPVDMILWKNRGARRSLRPDPDTGATLTIEVPYIYAEALLAQPPAPKLDCPVLACLMSSDKKHNKTFSSISVANDTSEVLIGGPHRWWEDVDVAGEVVDSVTEWSTTLPQ